MKRIHQIAAFCFIAFSAFFMWQSLGMEYYTDLGPGAGFFPLWLGAVLGGLAIVWLFQVSKRREESKNAITEIDKTFFEYRHMCLRMSFAPLSFYGLGHNAGHPKRVSEHEIACQIQNGHP